MKLLVIDTWNNEAHIFNYPNELEQAPEAVENFVASTKQVYTPFGNCHWQLFENFEIKIHG